MKRINQNSLPEGIVLGKRYKLNVNRIENPCTTLQYTFKPGNIDTKQQSTLTINEESQDVDIKRFRTDDSKPIDFKGSMKNNLQGMNPERDYVMVYSHDDNNFQLQRVDRSVLNIRQRADVDENETSQDIIYSRQLKGLPKFLQKEKKKPAKTTTSKKAAIKSKDNEKEKESVTPVSIPIPPETPVPTSIVSIDPVPITVAAASVPITVTPTEPASTSTATTMSKPPSKKFEVVDPSDFF